jgi:hypothetical protein
LTKSLSLTSFDKGLFKALIRYKRDELIDIINQRSAFTDGEQNILKMIVDNSMHGNVDQVCHYATRLLEYVKVEEEMFVRPKQQSEDSSEEDI